jgi:tRNA-splicing ligase RtcB
VHGAGRAISRRKATGKVKRGVVVTPGLVNWTEASAAVRAKGIELRGAGADEAPMCYKVLDEVLAYHAGTVKILHRLRPIGVAMAGVDTVDPYRD